MKLKISKSKFFFCNYVLFLKILSITLFIGSCNFDPENVHRKPLLILKIVPEAGYDVYTEKSTIRREA
jgi:hypothetical protein